MVRSTITMLQQPLARFDAVFRVRHLHASAGEPAPVSPEDAADVTLIPQVAEDAGLADLVLAVAEHGRVRVAGASQVVGRAALDSLLVRAWLFGVLTFLEGRARERIRRDPEWRSALSPGRLEKARALKDERSRRGRAIATVDALQFGDVGWLATRYEEWYAFFDVGSKRQAKRLVRQLEALRNALAHGQDVVRVEWDTVVAVARSVKSITVAEREVTQPRPGSSAAALADEAVRVDSQWGTAERRHSRQETAAMSETTGRCRRCKTELVPGARYCHACGAGVYVADPDQDYDFERLFNYAVDLLCIADTAGYFKVVNPAWEKALGYSVEELLSKPFVEFTHPEDRDVTVAETDSLSRGSPTLFFSNRYRRKDGSWVRLHWTAFPEPGTDLIYASARVEE